MTKTKTKKCSKCEEVKPTACFYRVQRYPDGLDYWCKGCKLSHKKRWHDENRERVYEYNRVYRAENLDRSREWQSKCHRNWYEKNREEKLQKNREWTKNNPQYVALKRARRRGSIESGEWIDLAFVQSRDTECYLCDQSLDYSLVWPDPMSRTLDHIVALKNGGTHTLDNVAYVHKVCNERKGYRVV